MAESDGSLKIRVSLNMKEFRAGSKELESAARRTAGKISDIGEKTKIALEKQLNSFSALNQQYARQEKRVEQLKQRLKELSEQKVKTEEYKTVDAEIKKTEEALDRAIERQIRFTETGGKIDSNAFQKMEYDIAQLNEKLDEARIKKEKLETSGNGYRKADTESVKNSLAIEQEKLLQTGNRLATANKALELRMQELKEKEEEAAESTEEITEATDEFSEAEEAASDSTEKLANREERLTDISMKLSNTSDRVASTVKRIASTISRGIFTIRGLGRQSDRTNMSLVKMLGTSILFSTVFRMISAVTSGAQEGVSNLAQYSDEADLSISSLITSLNYLKNSFAVAFAPILNIVAPIVSRLIDMLATAANYVAAFVAALTGKGAFVKAVKVQYDYADGLKDTASAAKDAADATKDAAKAADDYLSPLDEINRWQSDNNTTGASGSGNAGKFDIPSITPQDMFETVEIENSISGVANRVRELIQSEDWEGLGLFIANGINVGVQKIKKIISWDNIGPQVTYFVTALTTTLNSLGYNIDWDLIGQTFGTGVNTIVNTLLLLIGGINWKMLGISFATGINGALDTIDWNNLGILIGQKFMIAWNLFLGFVTTLNWNEVGLAFANSINGMLANINGETIGIGINLFILGILTAITIAIQNTDWTSVGQTIADMIKSIDWVGIATQLYEIGKELILGILAAFRELPEPVRIAIVAILAFWSALKVGSKVSLFITAIKTVITVLKGGGGLIAALKAVVTTLGGPVTLAIVAIAAVVAGAVALIVKYWDEIKAYFSGFLEWLSTIFTTYFSAILNVIGTSANSFANGIKEAINGLIRVFVGLIEFLYGVFTADWELAWQGIIDIFGGIFDTIVGLARAPVNAVIDLINGMIDAVETGLNWVIGGINSIHFTVPNWVPGIGGNSWGPNISYMNWGRIPRLASGAVIPPRSEFLAVLGDQKRGTNIETPEALLRQIMREEMQNNAPRGNATYHFYGQINRRTLFEEVIDEAKMRQSRTGQNPFELAY